MTAPVTWSPSTQAALDRLEGKLFATTTECAAVLRYDARTLRKAIEAREIPAVRAGLAYRIPVAWIMEQARLGGPQQPDEAAGDDPELDAQSNPEQIVRSE